MKPPIITPPTIPSSHRTSSTIAIVYNIKFSFGWGAGRFAFAPASAIYPPIYSLATAMVMLLTTLVTPLMSVASLVTRVFSASFLAMPVTMTTPSVVETPVWMALVERCDSSDDLTCAVMDASSILSPVVSLARAGVVAIVISFLTSLTLSMSFAYSDRKQRRLDLRRDGRVINLGARRLAGQGRRRGNRHLILDLLDVVNVLRVFRGQFLLGLAGGFALQRDDAVFGINRGAGGAHMAMEQQRGFHLRGDPHVRMFRRLFAADDQLIVHAFDAGQALHGVFGQRFVGRFGHRAGQGDDAVFGYRLDGIVLEVGFEDIRLCGGRLNAAVRAGRAQRRAGD